MRHYLEVCLKSVLAGFCIVIGSTGYLVLKSNDMMILGAFVFALGLYAIIHFHLWLFTSKISGVITHKPKYIIDVVICFVTNILSVMLLSFLLLQTRLGPTLTEMSKQLVEVKMNDTWYSILILSFMCGGLIYLAVSDGEKTIVKKLNNQFTTDVRNSNRISASDEALKMILKMIGE